MSQESTLLVTLGGQPQVLTFALDQLLARGEMINEVVALHLAPHEQRLQRALACLDGEFHHNAYRGHPCDCHHVIVGQSSRPLPEIADEADAEATWSTVQQLITQLKHEQRRLHLCVTGGPRLIGLLAMSAATLHFDHHDRLWHLYTPRALRTRANEGAIMHAQPADGVRLIQVPLAPWGAYFPALRTLTQTTPTQVIASQTRWLDSAEAAHCQAVIARLTARQLAVLRAFAAGQTPQEVAEHLVVTIKTVDAHKTVILAECRNVWALPTEEWLSYHFLRDKFARYFEPHDP